MLVLSRFSNKVITSRYILYEYCISQTNFPTLISSKVNLLAERKLNKLFVIKLLLMKVI